LDVTEESAVEGGDDDAFVVVAAAAVDDGVDDDVRSDAGISLVGDAVGDADDDAVDVVVAAAADVLNKLASSSLDKSAVGGSLLWLLLFLLKWRGVVATGAAAPA